jgi:hypothetical protein
MAVPLTGRQRIEVNFADIRKLDGGQLQTPSN